MNKIKSVLKNKNGNMFINLIIFIMIFIGVLALVMDFTNLNIKSKKIKYAVNNSVKASSLQILEGSELSDGVFLIDEIKAEDAFYQILSHNIGLDENTLEPLEKSLVYEKPVIKEFYVENVTPTNYYSATLNGTFPLDYPTTIAVVEFKIRGMLLKKTIRVAKLSSSQLKSVYEP